MNDIILIDISVHSPPRPLIFEKYAQNWKFKGLDIEKG